MVRWGHNYINKLIYVSRLLIHPSLAVGNLVEIVQ